MNETLRTLTGSPNLHTYEAFARHGLIQEVDRAFIESAPVVHTVVDLASGTGEIIQQLIELGKLKTPFKAIGIDIDLSAVNMARSKFLKFEDGVKFLEGDIEKDVPIDNSSTELVTCGNAIHLVNPLLVMQEAHRILVPNGEFMANSAYVKGEAYPDNTGRLWGHMTILAREEAKKHGYSNIPKPVNYLRYLKEDFVGLAQEAGFVDVKTQIFTVKMDRDSFKAICDYEDFARGALPGIPVDLARSLLVNAVDPMFDRAEVKYIPRNWVFFKARKGKT